MTSTMICRNITFFVTLMMPLVTEMPAAIADERQLFRIPGSNYEVVLGGPARRPQDVFEQPLLAAISAWLSMEFGLADILRYPEIELVSPNAIIALRYKGLSPHAPKDVASDSGEATQQASETMAIYSDHAETIYLTDGWSGRTPADLSVLVHEMVHHFQNVLHLKHECPQEREKLAFMAQERWLGLFGHSLEKDFELDGFSLLGKTRCFY
jgi:hypothetical protein